MDVRLSCFVRSTIHSNPHHLIAIPDSAKPALFSSRHYIAIIISSAKQAINHTYLFFGKIYQLFR